MASATKNTSNLEDMGKRLSLLRRERGLTQVQLAELMGISQAAVSQYECGGRRFHVELILELAEILEISTDELLGVTKKYSPTAVRNRRLLKRIQRIEALPRRSQEALFQTIDAFLK